MVYTFGHSIGSGAFGSVRIATKRLGNKNKKYAIKTMSRVLVEEDLEPVESELNILLQTDHTHIVKFYEAFLDHKYVHIVMELCPGADLN